MFWNRTSSPPAPVVTSRAEKLILYHYDGCFFCHRVRKVIDQMGLDIEYRNILQNGEHRQELAEARGRTTVPVLRGINKDDEWWMPESLDIVAYLKEYYAD